MPNVMSVLFFAIAGISAYAIYHYIHYRQVPKLLVKSGSKFEVFLKHHMSIIKEPYHVPFLCADGRLHTLFAALKPVKHQHEYKRDVMKTNDGGQFYIDSIENDGNLLFPDAEKRPTVIIVPGLTSTSQSNYIQSMVSMISSLGYRAAVIINRGLDGMEVLTAKVYCATHMEDIEHAVDVFKQRRPNAPVVAVGISLGSLMLGRYLYKTGKKCKLSAAMLNSCPFSAAESTKSIERVDNYVLFNRHLTGNLRALYSRVSHLFGDIVDHRKVMESKTIKEYDMHFTSKVFGYSSVDAYYEDSTLSSSRLQHVVVPTLCVNADDDPFAPISCIPDLEEVENVAVLLTRGGGHVGHLVGWNPFNITYFENTMKQFLQATFSR